jgi:hypothetical protein
MAAIEEQVKHRTPWKKYVRLFSPETTESFESRLGWSSQ